MCISCFMAEVPGHRDSAEAGKRFSVSLSLHRDGGLIYEGNRLLVNVTLDGAADGSSTPRAARSFRR